MNVQKLRFEKTSLNLWFKNDSFHNIEYLENPIQAGLSSSYAKVCTLHDLNALALASAPFSYKGDDLEEGLYIEDNGVFMFVEFVSTDKNAAQNIIGNDDSLLLISTKNGEFHYAVKVH